MIIAPIGDIQCKIALCFTVFPHFVSILFLFSFLFFFVSFRPTMHGWRWCVKSIRMQVPTNKMHSAKVRQCLERIYACNLQFAVYSLAFSLVWTFTRAHHPSSGAFGGQFTHVGRHRTRSSGAHLKLCHFVDATADCAGSLARWRSVCVCSIFQSNNIAVRITLLLLVISHVIIKNVSPGSRHPSSRQ